MTANRKLAEQLGLSEEDIKKIDSIHNTIDLYMEEAKSGVFNQFVYDQIEHLEYLLQDLWGFPKDCGYHTHKNSYKFKSQWCNRAFKDLVTEVIKTLEFDDVYEGAYIQIGESAIDLGRLDGYYRIINELEEVK